jgi:hydroxymethylglutaryl-CoA reductase (NADPH)
MNLREYQSAARRREALEQELTLNLANIGTNSLDEQMVSSKNCENLIGAVQVPVGVAGPLSVNGDYANGDFFLPLATTEGALVASVARGCKAINVSGGANASTCRVGQTRGPVFEVETLAERKKLYNWIKENEKKLKKVAEQTSKHLKLKNIVAQGVAHYLFVRFSFDTADAMGMNMVTIASEAMAQEIEKETGARCLSIAGNFDIDKKPAWLNAINNRGFPVWAEAIIKKIVVTNVLKTTPEALYDVWLSKCMIGSAMSGSMGFNAHYANIIAAMFIATGQDPAHVVEGSLGITTAKVLPSGDLYISIYLPALIVGTVGGGTGLATQKEALKILGVTGAGKVEMFAEIIGGAVLAGELSLLGSLAQGSLGEAHKVLGRGEKISNT